MTDAMKAIFGYDPEEVVAQAAGQLREALSAVAANFDAVGDEASPALREGLRAMSITNVLLAHQVHALASRPAGDMMWPAAEIYNALREVAAEALREGGVDV